jgi:PIN domain nuclease of toxin-antitoxin system
MVHDGDARLSAPAIAAIEQAETVSISAISLFEIGQKVRLGKWPEMAPFLRLISLAQEQGGRLMEVSRRRACLRPR